MVDQGLREVDHLEKWIVEHPEVLGPTVKVVTTQYDRWASASGAAAATERLDILALDSTGQLVVVELKRDGDRRIHLQAITYAALVAGFTKDTLGRVHAGYLNRGDEDAAVTPARALDQLAEHVDGDWDDDLLTRPRIVLIAEQFPPQVLTTVQWLSDLAPADFGVECHEVAVFSYPDEPTTRCVTFQRIFPVQDISESILSPIVDQAASAVSQKLADKKRQTRSVPVIAENQLIPQGAMVSLELDTLVRPEIVKQVGGWLDGDESRRRVTWINDAHRPLKWAADPQGRQWSATGLGKEIVEQATGGAARVTFSGPDAWQYQGRTFYWIASEFLGSQDLSADQI